MGRPIIDKFIEVAREQYSRYYRDYKERPRIIVLEAPTGYGKSYVAPRLFKELSDCGYIGRLIHALPLRAIIYDVLFNKDSGLLKRIDAGDITWLKRDDIGYQMGEYLVGVGKTPLFNASYVVTTMDSLLYNFFRIPVTEIFEWKKHYAIPRLRIFTSGIYLDEAHMIFGEEEDEPRMFVATMTMLREASRAGIPIMMASATMGRKTIEELAKNLSDVELVIVRYRSRAGTSGPLGVTTVDVEDRDFEDKLNSITFKTEFAKSLNEGLRKALNIIYSGRKVFIALDTVERAIKAYAWISKQLGRENVVLLHGLLTRGDREGAMKRLDHAKVLVATSVVEAGVNMNFDALVTDCSRPRSVIQRAGRVCRRFDECKGEAEVILLKDKCSEELINYVKEKDMKVNWRNPYSDPSRGFAGYGELLDRLPAIDEVGGEDLRKLQRDLLNIIESTVIASGTINDIFEEHGYALVRTMLVTVFIGMPKDYEDAVNRSITLDLNRFSKVLHYVESYALIYLNGASTKFSVSIKPQDKLKQLAKNIIEIERGIIRELKQDHIGREDGGEVVMSGFVIKEEKYEPGIGLRLGEA